MTLAVIVPSRGRPQNITALADAWGETDATADLIVGVDDDDPTLPDYLDVIAASPANVDLVVGPRLRMAGTLNQIAARVADDYDHLGFMGDDHRPRTTGWDVTICAELDRLRTGVVYGNDLIQGERLPTAAFLTANIVRTLGWMAPPGLQHLFLDDAWKTLGQMLDAITYLPDLIIEHVHPVAGKVTWDDGYRECNAPDVWGHDQQVYTDWVAGSLRADVERIRAAARV